MNSITSKPWGSFEVIDQGKNFVVKKILVNPKSKLSLQSHRNRSEHWIIVEGEAEVTLDNKQMTMYPNQSIYIPKNSKHRLTNNSDDNLIVVEVWYGNILEEEDIIRYEDIYNRS